MKASLHTLVYAAVLGAVCALLLTGASRLLDPYKQANEKAEEVRNILGVLGVALEPGASPQELVAMFDSNMQVSKRGALTIYRYVPGQGADEVKAVAVAFAGQGLWGPIKGFLALDPDMKTIRGITFQHEETPGLGGEIGSEQFRARFAGRSLVSATGQPGVRIRQPQAGQAAGMNEVDAITGATMTCQKVEQMLNAVIAEIVKERDRDDQ